MHVRGRQARIARIEVSPETTGVPPLRGSQVPLLAHRFVARVQSNLVARVQSEARPLCRLLSGAIRAHQSLPHHVIKHF